MRWRCTVDERQQIALIRSLPGWELISVRRNFVDIAQPGVKYEKLEGIPTKPRVRPGKDRPGRRHLSADHRDLASVGDAFRAMLPALLVLLLAASTGRAQQGPDDDPDSAPGFVNNAFHSPDIDSVNLYNGQLAIPIPLGSSYPIGPNLRFQALLTYNLRLTEPGDPTFQGAVRYEPLVGNPALGIGWNLQLGKIGWCGGQGGICYFRPDGAEISFGQSEGAGFYRTKDASRYRLYAPNGLAGPLRPEMWDEDGNHYVFNHQVVNYDDDPTFSPGYIHDFGRGRNGWYLTSVTDPFNNSYSITYRQGINTPDGSIWANDAGSCYSMAPLPNPPGNTWMPDTINLPGGQIVVQTDSTNQNRISGLTFPVPYANGNPNATAVWTISYQSVPYTRLCQTTPRDVNLQVISAIQPPLISTKYEFTYSPCQAPGRLATMKLPTGATVSYEYAFYTFYHGRIAYLGPQCSVIGPPNAPVEISERFFCGEGPDLPEDPGDPTECDPETPPRYRNIEIGLARRTISGLGLQPAETTYTQYAFPYGEQGHNGDKRDPENLTVVVHPPDVDGKQRAEGVLFWGGPKKACGIPPYTICARVTGDRTGADTRHMVYEANPNTGSVLQPACAGANSHPFCADKAVRVTKRTYEYENNFTEQNNRRLQEETTFYGPALATGECPSCKQHTVRYEPMGASWETNGRHYADEKHSGNLGSDARTISTTWSPVIQPSFWFPNRFNRRCTTTTGTPCTASVAPNTRDERYYYDADSAYLKARTTWEYIGLSTLRQFTTCRYPFSPSAGGVPQYEVSATATGSFSPDNYPCLPTLADWGSFIGTNGDAFGKEYTYSPEREVLTSRWIEGQLPVAWKATDLVRAPATGWIRTSRDSAGLATEYARDTLGRITAITPPGSELPTNVTYPSATQTIATRSGGGFLTEQIYDYDQLGRPIRETRRMPGVNQYAKRFRLYDKRGYEHFTSEWISGTASESFSTAQSATCSFSGTGYATSRPSAAPGTYRLCYDPFGRPQEIVGPKHSSLTKIDRTDTQYYSETREVLTTHCVNGTLNPAGTCTTVNQNPPENPVSTYLRDAFGKITRVTEPGSDVTDYAYDINGKLTSVTQSPQSRTFTYDPAGNLRTETTPEKGSVTYDEYGSLGNLIQETLAGGLIRRFCHDAAGRITATKTSEDGPAPNCEVFSPLGRVYATSAYDGSTGRLTNRTASNFAITPSPTITDTFNYHAPTGRIASQTTSITAGPNLTTTQSWTYNTLGLVAHHYHPRPFGATPFVVSYAYEAGLPVTEFLNGIPMVTGITYQPSGALSSYTTGVNTGKNVTTSITQDTPLSRPSRIQATLQPSTVLFDTSSYLYDGAGNILQMGGDAFTYDNRSRLVWASYAAMGTQAFTYDRYANLTSKAGISYGINLNTNQLTSAGYDSRGNLTTNGSETYGYDGLDRQTTHIGGGSTWKYLYDGRDERLAKIPPVGDWTHTFRDDANRVVTEYAGTTHSRDNVFLGGLAVASYANNAVAGNNPVWTFYSSDHLGTPRLITRLTGTDAESRKSWPYGEDATAPSPFQRLRFALMERDTEASRYYDHARNHDFGLGRFLSPDAVGGSIGNPQSWNRYAYAGTNPMTYLDPDGNEKTSFWIQTVKNAWRQVTRQRAIEERVAKGEVRVRGPRASRDAERLMKDAVGSRTTHDKKIVRHDPHDPSRGPDEPHYKDSRKKSKHTLYDNIREILTPIWLSLLSEAVDQGVEASEEYIEKPAKEGLAREPIEEADDIERDGAQPYRNSIAPYCRQDPQRCGLGGGTRSPF